MRAGLLLALVILSCGCDAPDERWLQGYAEAEYLRLGAPEAGWLASVPVERGDRVEAGAALFTLEAEKQRAAVRAAAAELARAQAQLADLQHGKRPEEIAEIEAKLAEARAIRTYAQQDLERQVRLTRRDVAAEARLDLARSTADEAVARVAAIEAELAVARLPARADQIEAAAAAVESARGELAQAQWQLDQRTVRAPVAALVEDRLRLAGEWTPAGGIVVSLLPPGHVKVRFFVPEPLVGGLVVGQEVTLRCDGCSGSIPARLRYVAPQAEFTPPVIYSVGNREKLVFMAEAWPEGEVRLQPGQPVDVLLDSAAASAG